MAFNYWSVYVLLVFLINRNPFLSQRWPKLKLDMVRFMSRSVVLWKLRGVLCAATREDILDAYLCGYFWNRDLLDSVVRVIKLRGWHKTSMFAGIFRRHAQCYKRLPERERPAIGFEGRPDSDCNHKDDSEAEKEDCDNGEILQQPCDFIQTGDGIMGPSRSWMNNYRVFDARCSSGGAMDPSAYVATAAAAAAASNDEFRQNDGAVPGCSSAGPSADAQHSQPPPQHQRSSTPMENSDSDVSVGSINDDTGLPVVYRKMKIIDETPATHSPPLLQETSESADSSSDVETWDDEGLPVLSRKRNRIDETPATHSPSLPQESSQPAELSSDAETWDDDEEMRRANKRARMILLADSDAETVIFEEEEREDEETVEAGYEQQQQQPVALEEDGEEAYHEEYAPEPLGYDDEEGYDTPSDLSEDSGYDSAFFDDLANREKVAEIQCNESPEY